MGHLTCSCVWRWDTQYQLYRTVVIESTSGYKSNHIYNNVIVSLPNRLCLDTIPCASLHVVIVCDRSVAKLLATPVCKWRCNAGDDDMSILAITTQRDAIQHPNVAICSASRFVVSDTGDCGISARGCAESGDTIKVALVAYARGRRERSTGAS